MDVSENSQTFASQITVASPRRPEPGGGSGWQDLGGRGQTHKIGTVLLKWIKIKTHAQKDI